MAHCVISAVFDVDLGEMRPGCVVHASWAPCFDDGQPASTTSLHTFPDPSRDQAVRNWRLKTHGQRPLVLHRGDVDEDHQFDTGSVCWCNPEVLHGAVSSPADTTGEEQ